ncbi:MAG: glycosyltransferase family 2 protein [Thermoleophilia bacterium]|nr:glycosyltransferase family 2 protein [Thermoleophilia bacterium]
MLNFFKRKNTLVMTLLAKNEGDIIRENIEFHLRSGVDYIVATDNASTDGTREIFQEYERKGLLRLIDEPGDDKDQKAWVNRMGEQAVNDLKADIVIHNDADEFWISRSGNLKKDLCSHRDADVFIVERVNVILEDREGKENFPKDAIYAVVEPFDAADVQERSKKDNLYYYTLGPKIAFRSKAGCLRVVQGNHAIENQGASIRQKAIDNVKIYHFPVRSKKHFEKKVAENGVAVARNARLNETQSWHIKRWYHAYLEGRLDEEYKKLIISKDEAARLVAAGNVAKIDASKMINRLSVRI